MGFDINLPTLGLIAGSAIIGAINPCSIGGLVLMVSVILASKKSKQKLLVLGGVYIFTIFTTQLLIGLGLLSFLSFLPWVITKYISVTMGTVIVLLGLVEIKDYFWYGRGFSLVIPESLTHQMHKISKITTIFGAVVASLIMVSGQLFCTGASYLAIITIISANFNWTGLLMMVTYNLVYVLPLVIILLLVSSGTKLHFVKSWKQESRGMMRLIIGLLLVSLGWLLILISGGAIRL
ncbi:hypothetical protein A3H85_02510 [Candidatus Daviesbacteria bacterium RIFCSPLOWO2_02_FULL_40_8]|uniref:Cytochrome C biogenesis protein transmembrane domain-containing protein n=1 Tax=Candidatus Daviesbacteria bacterium RIFCSPLOWO2_01_FULL_40_24 TaxID=1797787 RepID=A0A1F5MIE3_9BACT|nr:MAG: hypothetical protein A2780_03240 [Candidatus Daviesbacteria bacterium RIFCSPHIGHO2_01_FULL_41_45]OGE34162.1 MAG: hypothetical protein A3C32_00325 [Candidatus Daviesbacteria bacterium RIFCSPHIGHO2_02_FULL_41_14]OGE65146.1 MAG: hypothetical protein A3B49_01275 [Candidatus Daviesbacteria bacterium RIFCSPLOWO2_01_FULL_40_24]OGE66850.1 MAG: hypothetical protein A3H85_02510 [Candidatus Daviesbacteria bacterium RIFCSPLOWO2_02_FULL_40_8]